jgi:hypothetical protein
LTSPVTIDGYSQAGATANTLASGDDAKLKVELDATNISPALWLNGAGSGGSTIQGLAITHMASIGIKVANGSANNRIVGNFIGVNVAGTATSGTNTALDIESSNATTIGGTTPEVRNMLSGNDVIVYVSGCDNTVIQGNYINIDATGTAALAAGLRGIDLGAGSSNLIGGSTPGAGNVIAAWSAHGIIFQGSGSDNLIQGNLIGMDATGSVRLGAGQYGITYYEGSGTGNKIGGAAAGEGNVINGATISALQLFFDTSPDLAVQGNLIGTDASGTIALGNAQGILVYAGAGIIGGTGAGAGNRIAFSSSLGVSIFAGAKNVPILGNDIYANGSLGISLSGTGTPTQNDDGDGDPGNNNLQNYPVISTVTISPRTTVHVSGSLNSEADKAYRLEFFANANCDASGNGEGKIFIGSADVTTITNPVAFGTPLALDFTVPADRHVITATATELVGAGLVPGSTSEFSACATQDTIFSDGVEGN